jgi:hypothetical protein
MIELIQILAVVFSGLFAAEAIIASNGTKAERKQKRDGARWAAERCQRHPKY